MAKVPEIRKQERIEDQMEILEEDNIPWHEIGSESARVFTNIAFTARNIFLDEN